MGGIHQKILVFAGIGLFCSSLTRAQITEPEFTQIGEKLRKIYEPKAQATGETLYMNLDWNDTQMANASHVTEYNQYEISVTGDHARLPGMTADAFSLLVCHEFGHLFGGAPFSTYVRVSYEGQADYNSTQKCFKALVARDDNAAVVVSAGDRITPKMRSLCQKVYRAPSDELNICLRGMLASLSLIQSKYPLEKVSLTTPDKEESYFTKNEHPGSQCRLDTLVAGLLCNNSKKVSKTNHNSGSCTRTNGHTIGLRPRCWFNPDRI